MQGVIEAKLLVHFVDKNQGLSLKNSKTVNLLIKILQKIPNLHLVSIHRNKALISLTFYNKTMDYNELNIAKLEK